MRNTLFTIIAVGLAAAAQPALAQDTSSSSTGNGSTSFRGFRLEGNVGGDRFQSQGVHNDKLGYGATIGFDGVIANRIVIGPEASFWRANNWNENCSAVTGGNVCHKSFEEVGVGVRAGVLVSPKFLIFGKGGYVVNEQRKSFVTTGGSQAYYNHDNSTGYQLGGGVEYTLSDSEARLPIYIGAQYVYSQYADHTSRQRMMGTVGIRFK